VQKAKTICRQLCLPWSPQSIHQLQKPLVPLHIIAPIGNPDGMIMSGGPDSVHLGCVWPPS
jgi:hypothetical protein